MLDYFFWYDRLDLGHVGVAVTEPATLTYSRVGERRGAVICVDLFT